MFFFDKYFSPQKVYVYTDGSYRDGVYAGAFLVYQGPRCIYSDSGSGTKAASMRNVAGELSAVMRAARWLRRNNYRGVIVYDYTGIYEWLVGNWQTKNEYTRAYKKFMEPYVNGQIVTFKWVKAHSGELGNTLADQLAKEALNKRKAWS